MVKSKIMLQALKMDAPHLNDKLTHNNSTDKHNYSVNSVFANRSDEEIYPLTVKEIAEA